MVTLDSGSLTLTCHPQTPSRSISKIDVVFSEAKRGSLVLHFSLVGELSALRIPEPRSPRRADGLWRHTCFEAFVMAGEGPGYREFNFSPSGEWAVYDFRGYRDGGVLEMDHALGIVVHRSMDRLELAAEIGQDLLPRGRPLRLGLSAVVEDAAGLMSYWALRHPAGKPDFHHNDAFALQLEKP